MNLLSENDLKLIDQSKLNDSYVNFNAIKQFKDQILKIAFENFRKNSKNSQEILNEFYQSEKYWIDDFILFIIIKEKVRHVQRIGLSL
jgi:4-alpha-glucanotransferase